MRAIVIDHCCAAADLHVTHLPKPQPKAGWVVVRIMAAGLNHSEALLRLHEADRPYIHTPVVPGIECVGLVDAVDPADADLPVGTKVIALMGGMGRSFDGSYADYALLPRTHVFPVDTDMDWVTLAAIPETYYTAYASLTAGLRLASGDVLLVRGATSTVGQAAIQLGKALGATVVATSRRREAEATLRSIGADDVLVDDGALANVKHRCRPNKALELIGPATLPDTMQLVQRPGYVCHTGVLGNVFAFDQFYPLKDIPTGVYLTGFHSNNPTPPVIDAMMQLIAQSGILPRYSRVFTLEQIAQAHALLERGDAGGKIVLKIAP